MYPIYILSYNRANSNHTYKLLKKLDYPINDIFVVVADDDPQIETYKKIHGDFLLTFSRDALINRYDAMTNNPKRNVVYYIRNHIYELAKKNNHKRFLMLDDDYYLIYTNKFLSQDLRSVYIRNRKMFIDILDTYFELLDADERIKLIAFAQSGEMMGDQRSHMPNMFRRKAMNFFFCDSDKPVEFVGELNEDVNAYVLHGSVGDIFLTPFYVILKQKPTQYQAGGLTEAYLDVGTYRKSYYSVMLKPSAVRLSKIGYTNIRVHHNVAYNYLVPKIISEQR